MSLLSSEYVTQTYYYVLMFLIFRVLAHTLLIFIILVCVLIFFLFSIFARAVITVLFCGVIHSFI